jgi:hypothetical protein
MNEATVQSSPKLLPTLLLTAARHGGQSMRFPRFASHHNSAGRRGISIYPSSMINKAKA